MTGGTAAARSGADAKLVAGSFRDPSGGVVLSGDRVYRFFRPGHTSDFSNLLDSGLLTSLADRSLVVDSQVVSRDQAPEVYALGDVELVVEHPRITFVSYPYEWPFEMLKAAALLTLDILEEALAAGYILKDATPFNVQFNGCAPIFIDVASFEKYEEGMPWMAYSQFCRTFLNPLLLQSVRGQPYHPWLRGSLDGISPEAISALLPLRSKLRPSILMDVGLQAWFNQRARKGGDKQTSKAQAAQRKEPRIPKAVITGMVNRLRRTISGLKRPGARLSVWLDYEEHLPYEREALEFKDRFVSEALEAAAPAKTWDLGCNTGRFSMMAAERSGHVVAMDFDEAAVGALYHRSRENYTNLLPIVMDFMNPSPNMGWEQIERPGLIERGPADFGLCLALVHHLAISGNVPLDRIVAWLSKCTRAGVVEFVPKADPMVQTLLKTRKDVYPDYTPEVFHRALESRFRVDEAIQIPNSERVLFRVSA